jgi:hypothetical protein
MRTGLLNQPSDRNRKKFLVSFSGLPSFTASNLTELYRHGEVIQLGYSGGQMVGLLSPELRLPLIDQIRKVEEASTPASKGTSLEELLARIFSMVPGFEVTSRIHTETEEIDLVVLNGSGEPRWRAEKPLILVECKNWSSRCGKNELVQFREKLRNRRTRPAVVRSWRCCELLGTRLQQHDRSGGFVSSQSHAAYEWRVQSRCPCRDQWIH